MGLKLTPLEQLAQTTVKTALEILTQQKITKVQFIDVLAMLRNLGVRFEKYEAGCVQGLHQGDCTCNRESAGQSVSVLKTKRRILGL